MGSGVGVQSKVVSPAHAGAENSGALNPGRFSDVTWEMLVMSDMIAAFQCRWVVLVRHQVDAGQATVPLVTRQAVRAPSIIAGP